MRRKVVEGVITFSAAACLYLAFLSRQFDLNGIAEAQALDAGSLFSANHLLYRPLGLLFQTVIAAFGFHDRSVVVLQCITAVCGAAGTALAYIFFHKITGSRISAAMSTTWLGTSWAYWAYSTDAIYIPVAAMFAGAALTAFFCLDGNLSLLLTGISTAFAILLFQANIFLVPVFLLALCLLKPAPWFAQYRTILKFLTACILPVGAVYVVAASAEGVRHPDRFLHWVTSHGSGMGLPMWGHIDTDRLLKTGELSFTSVVARESQLGLFVYGALLVIAAWGVTRRLSRSGRSEIRLISWLALSYALYLPFIIWWDPSPEWFIIPNIFLGAILASGFSVLLQRRDINIVLPCAIAFIAVANFDNTIRPRHSVPSQNMQLAACVAANTGVADLVLAADWGWDGYLRYFFGRSELNFIKRVAATGNKEAALRQIRQRIAEVQARNSDAYMIEPLSYPKAHLAWLRGQTGITLQDLDEFKGNRAFECQGTQFWRVRHSFEARDIQEQLAVSLKSSSAATLATLDAAGVLSVGYAQLTGSPVERINGFTSIRLQSQGSLVSEAYIPLSVPVTAAQMYVEIDDNINTAISITNAGSNASRVNFSFFEPDGSLAKSGVLYIPGQHQLSRYLTEPPFSAKRPWTGRLILNSASPVSVIALRMSKSGSGPMFSPVIPDLPGMSKRHRLIPFFAVGNAWKSEVVLRNPGNEPIEGDLQYVFAGSTESAKKGYWIPPRGVTRILLPESHNFRIGYIRILPRSGRDAPLASTILSRSSTEVADMRVSIEPVEPDSRQVLYVERNKLVTTRVVIINPSGRGNTAVVQLKDFDGTPMGAARKLVLRAGAMTSFPIDEFEPAEGSDKAIEGLLSITAEPDSQIAALSLRQLPGEDEATLLSSIRPLNDMDMVSGRPGPVFLNVVHGGGYSSHFMFFNSSKTEAKFGLRFFSGFGRALKLPIRTSYKSSANS